MSVEQPESVAGTTPTPPSPTVTYPDDYEELRRQNAEYAQTLDALRPYADDIRPLIEDEGKRKLWRDTQTAYERINEERAPKLSPELQLLREDLVKEAGPAVAWVNEQRAEQEKARAADEKAKADAQAEAQKSNLAYAQRLAAERPDLAEDGFAGIGMLAAYAANRGVSLEEAYKTAGSRFSAPPAKKSPPTSLRGDAAAPGVPGPSELPKATSLSQLRDRLAANARAGMKG